MEDFNMQWQSELIKGFEYIKRQQELLKEQIDLINVYMKCHTDIHAYTTAIDNNQLQTIKISPFGWSEKINSQDFKECTGSASIEEFQQKYSDILNVQTIREKLGLDDIKNIKVED